MAHVRQEFALGPTGGIGGGPGGLQFGGARRDLLLQVGVEVTQRRLRVLARGDVHQDGQPADHLPLAIVDGDRRGLADPAPAAGQDDLQLQRRGRAPLAERPLQGQGVRLQLLAGMKIAHLAPRRRRLGRGGGDLRVRRHLVPLAEGPVGLNVAGIAAVGEGHGHRKGIQQGLEMARGRRECFFHLPALGDVEGGADIPDQPPPLIEHGIGQVTHPPFTAIRPPDAMFQLEWRLGRQGRAKGLIQARGIVGMDAAVEHGAIIGRGRGRIEAIDAAFSGGPDRCLGGDLILPGAELGDGFGLLHEQAHMVQLRGDPLFLGQGQHGLGALALP